MAFSDDLLEQSDHLARREKNRPRQASLRRAVSTAYYALFHLLTSEAVVNWKQVEHRHLLARTFEHGNMRRVADEQVKSLHNYFRSNPPSGASRATAEKLYRVAKVFLQLQAQRHLADYDNSIIWTRTDVLEQTDAAKQAFQSWKAIRDSSPAQDFLFSLMLKRR